MDRHSRAVAYLKVLLPLTALVLLSTLFMVSRGSDIEAVIPFADQDIEDRLRGQQVTGPYFSGTTSGGDEIMVTASLARPGGAGAPAVAVNLEAEILMAGGGRIALSSDTGAVYPDRDRAEFAGGVTITSADGMKVETETLNTALSGLEAESPGPVRARGPIGDLTAGNMRIHVKTEGGPAHMLFKDGVKLIYDPQKPER